MGLAGACVQGCGRQWKRGMVLNDGRGSNLCARGWRVDARAPRSSWGSPPERVAGSAARRPHPPSFPSPSPPCMCDPSAALARLCKRVAAVEGWPEEGRGRRRHGWLQRPQRPLRRLAALHPPPPSARRLQLGAAGQPSYRTGCLRARGSGCRSAAIHFTHLAASCQRCPSAQKQQPWAALNGAVLPAFREASQPASLPACQPACHLALCRCRLAPSALAWLHVWVHWGGCRGSAERAHGAVACMGRGRVPARRAGGCRASAPAHAPSGAGWCRAWVVSTNQESRGNREMRGDGITDGAGAAAAAASDGQYCSPRAAPPARRKQCMGVDLRARRGMQCLGVRLGWAGRGERCRAPVCVWIPTQGGAWAALWPQPRASAQIRRSLRPAGTAGGKAVACYGHNQVGCRLLCRPRLEAGSGDRSLHLPTAGQPAQPTFTHPRMRSRPRRRPRQRRPGRPPPRGRWRSRRRHPRPRHRLRKRKERRGGD